MRNQVPRTGIIAAKLGGDRRRQSKPRMRADAMLVAREARQLKPSTQRMRKRRAREREGLVEIPYTIVMSEADLEAMLVAEGMLEPGDNARSDADYLKLLQALGRELIDLELQATLLARIREKT